MSPANCYRTLLTAAALTVALTACVASAQTDKGAPSVDTTLRTSVAMNNLVAFMTDTLGALGPATSLARTNPVAGADSLSDGTNVPCEDNNQTGHGPVSFQLSLFVQGLADGSGPQALDAIEARWSSKGWAPRRNTSGSTRKVQAVAQGGYALSAVLNNRGALALSGSSPCFPFSNADPGAGAPSAIPHPG